MSKVIAAWIVAALAVVACVAASQQPVGNTPFDLACQKLQSETHKVCDFEPPEIVESSLLRWLQVDGMYVGGEPHIYILPDLPTWRRPTVILHETIHYVIYEADLLPDGDTHTRMCFSERLTRQWVEDITGQPKDPVWANRYGCGVDAKEDSGS